LLNISLFVNGIFRIASHDDVCFLDRFFNLKIVILIRVKFYFIQLDIRPAFSRQLTVEFTDNWFVFFGVAGKNAECSGGFGHGVPSR